MTHQTLSLEKYWKLFPATLSLNIIMHILEAYSNSVVKYEVQSIHSLQNFDILTSIVNKSI